MDSTTRVLNTTIAEYIRKEEVNILRKRKLTAMLQSKGRISFNHSGTKMDWKVRYKRASMNGYAPGDTLTFAPTDRHKTAELDWRAYSATDSLNKFERLQNRNTEAIVKMATQIGTFLKDDIQDNFAEELYVDGNATGNTKRIHGIESFFGGSVAATNGYIVQPSDTYAGLSTVLGNYGGTWSTSSSNVTWPIGVGSAEYDFWSPLIVDYGNSSFNASSDNWRNNCREVLGFAITHSMSKNQQSMGELDLFLLDNELYRVLKDVCASKEQININRGGGDGLVALGFKDVINIDGVEVTSEYGVPANVGYGIPLGAIELRSMQDVLFAPETDKEISTKSDRFAVDFFGNLRCNPRPFVKLVDLP